MYAVDELKQAGFEIWTESGKIRYKQVTEGPVDEVWISNLLQNIKEHKQDAISYLQQEPTPKTITAPISSPIEPGPVAEPQQQEAKLISSSLQYLDGIDDGQDLTGWTLWERIEQGKEHRWATDPAGVIRWERWYSIEPRVIIG